LKNVPEKANLVLIILVPIILRILFCMKESQYTDIHNTIKEFKERNPQWVVIIWWTTATGKTQLSLRLAKAFWGEIISSDSRQIFTFMDIGTDKVNILARKNIPHHQMDIVYPDETYTAAQWQQDTKKIISDIHQRQALPLVVGGTGLYIDTIYKNYSIPHVPPNQQFRNKLYIQEQSHPGSLHEKLQKVDPESAIAIHPNSIRYIVRALEIYHTLGVPKSIAMKQHPVQRPMLMIGLWRETQDNEERILKRSEHMLESWLIQEVQRLLDQWYAPHLQSMQWIGYKQTVQHLLYKTTQQQLIEDIAQATRAYAKKQRTWLRRYCKDAESHAKKDVEYKIFNID